MFELRLGLFCFALTVANTAVSAVFSGIYQVGQAVFGLQLASSLLFATAAAFEYRNARGVYPWGSTSFLPRSVLPSSLLAPLRGNVTNNYYYVTLGSGEVNAMSEEQVREILRGSKPIELA